MATIEKRGSSWCVRYRVRDEYGNLSNSKRKSGFPDRNSAMAFAKQIEDAANAGVDVHGDRLACGELMERWFDAKVNHVQLTTLSKYSQYMDRLKEHPIFDTPVRNLRRDSLGSLIADLSAGDKTHKSVSISTATYYTEPLRFALKWAADEGLIIASPFVGAHMPKGQSVAKTLLSEQDVDDLVRTCATMNPAFLTPLYLAIYGGLCREECVGLKWDHVDMASGLIRIDTVTAITSAGKLVTKEPKTAHRTRSVTMPRFVMDHLRQQEHVSDYVCVSRTGKPYKPYSYAHALKRLIDQANVQRGDNPPIPRVTFHDLRHTHAAICIALNVQPKVISERLGHASIKITMDLYGYLMPGMQEQVADALDQRWA